jgi:hypothetical protein
MSNSNRMLYHTFGIFNFLGLPDLMHWIINLDWQGFRKCDFGGAEIVIEVDVYLPFVRD